MLFQPEALTLLMIVIMAVCLELNQKAETNKQMFSIFGRAAVLQDRA